MFKPYAVPSKYVKSPMAKKPMVTPPGLSPQNMDNMAHDRWAQAHAPGAVPVQQAHSIAKAIPPQYAIQPRTAHMPIPQVAQSISGNMPMQSAIDSVPGLSPQIENAVYIPAIHGTPQIENAIYNPAVHGTPQIQQLPYRPAQSAQSLDMAKKEKLRRLMQAYRGM